MKPRNSTGNGIGCVEQVDIRKHHVSDNSVRKKFSLQALIERHWYGRPGFLLILLPLEWLFFFITQKRKKTHRRQSAAYPCPVIVVGNISVGGTGKTPTIIALVKQLQSSGKNPGVISRGYGRHSDNLMVVKVESDASDVGDEPLLIYRSTQCPVAVSRNRSEAIHMLYNQYACDVILSDDGLQHYKMHRDGEIVVVDGERLFGNGHLLPVGPLREYPSRLQQADWVLVNMPSGLSDIGAGVDDNVPVAQSKALSNAHIIRVKPVAVTDIVTGQQYSTEILTKCNTLVAVAGLGNPEKFFKTLDSLGVVFEKRPFPDHHRYCSDDFVGLENKTLIMTEKDAVKCHPLIKGQAYCLNIEMTFPDEFLQDFNGVMDR